jgi:hypothetical protein
MMARGAVTTVVARAARRAGLGTVHVHRLRHSAATAMLVAGASLGEIGQVLRHRDALTATIYAKVDIEALRTIARVWLGSECLVARDANVGGAPVCRTSVHKGFLHRGATAGNHRLPASSRDP